MEVKLVTITAYATHHGIARSTVYELIKNNTLTLYRAEDGRPKLNIDQRPIGLKKHTHKDPKKTRKRRVV